MNSTMNDPEKDPEEVVLRRMIAEAERSYERIEKPKVHRITMGNDPKQAGIDCTEFRPTEKNKMGNFCVEEYLKQQDEKATRDYANHYPHCIWKQTN